MSTVLSTSLLVNGLQAGFEDTYLSVMNRQADSRLAEVMDLGSITIDNRTKQFGYHLAAPHATYWPYGDAIPVDAFGSVNFEAVVWPFARRVRWHKYDRKDDQTQSLMDMARQAGTSFGLLPERFFFDLLTNSTNTLPAVPLAPDGAAMYATTASSVARFGVTNGNLLSGSGVTTLAGILTDYYSCITQWMRMQDGKGQPLLSPEQIASGVIIIHGAANTQVFEQAFMQMRQGIGISAAGVPATSSVVAGINVSNIVQDASRNVMLWSTPRITDNDWYVFLRNPPKKATALVSRDGVNEQTSMEGSPAGDETNTTGLEYIQWDMRAGALIALPYATIKVNN